MARRSIIPHQTHTHTVKDTPLILILPVTRCHHRISTLRPLGDETHLKPSCISGTKLWCHGSVSLSSGLRNGKSYTWFNSPKKKTTLFWDISANVIFPLRHKIRFMKIKRWGKSHVLKAGNMWEFSFVSCEKAWCCSDPPSASITVKW